MLRSAIYVFVTALVWAQTPSKAASLPMFEYDIGDLVPRRMGSAKYAVMIDAGSTGSSLKVFKFRVNSKGKVSSDKDVESLPYKLGKVRPGLSSFADDQSGLEDYLKKLVDGAKNLVPSDAQASTPVLLMATAGLRLLTEQQQKKILSEVRRVFKDKKVSPFQFKDENAQVISGTKEAVYDWITVNFLKGIFSKNGRKVRKHQMMIKTYGSLDLGGASTQVTFSPFQRKQNREIVEIGNKKYKLYAKSYLSYGTKEIHNRFLRFLGQSGKKDRDGNIESPCHHDGLKETFEVDGKKIPVIGVADGEKCFKLVDRLFFCGKSLQSCPFENQPSLNDRSEKFYALAAFHIILKRVGALCGPCSDSLVKVHSMGYAAKNYCNKKYYEVSKDPYAKFSCLWSVYIHELFTKGYRFKENYEVTVLKEMNGFELNWILGSMLYKLDLV